MKIPSSWSHSKYEFPGYFFISTMYIQILLSLNSLGLTALVMHGGGIPTSANSFAVFAAIFTVFILS